MRAQVLYTSGPVEDGRLVLEERPVPAPGPGELVIRVAACGVCHTDLDEVEGRLPPRLPVVLGHQIVGRIEAVGAGVTRFRPGDRVGVAWIAWACGRCARCRAGSENLCANARWTGKDVDGGYAEYTRASAQFVYRLPDRFSDVEAAPLLCAGVIGYRALRRTGLQDGETLALYGFGASAHLVLQVVKARWPATRVFVVTRSAQHRALAAALGADWTGEPGTPLPDAPDRAIDFTPVGSTVRDALGALAPGGRLVVNAIRKRDTIPPLDYAVHVWQEKELTSTANVTRRDAEEFLALAADLPLVPTVEPFPLGAANAALVALKQGRLAAAAVLVMS